MQALANLQQAADPQNFPAAKMRFLGALIVPDKAQICGGALDMSSGWSSTGLEKLRVLSQGVKDAAQRAEQGLELVLGGVSQLDSLPAGAVPETFTADVLTKSPR